MNPVIGTDDEGILVSVRAVTCDGEGRPGHHKARTRITYVDWSPPLFPVPSLKAVLDDRSDAEGSSGIVLTNKISDASAVRFDSKNGSESFNV